MSANAYCFYCGAKLNGWGYRMCPHCGKPYD